MDKSRLVSYLFMFLGILITAFSSYFLISSAGDIINGVVEFVSLNDISKLQRCSITIPEQLSRVRSELATSIIPILYVGFPFLLIVLSCIMFVSGFYYHKASYREDLERIEKAEREIVNRFAKKAGVRPRKEETKETAEEAAEGSSAGGEDPISDVSA